MKCALIIGARGQDGRYLVRLLLREGYRVIGAVRDVLPEGPDPIEYVAWDTSSLAAIDMIISRFRPDEIYNFAARTSGAGMFDDPVASSDVNGLAVTRILEAIRHGHPHARFMQASSSEIFGRAEYAPQSESTPTRPRSPYGAAKLYAHTMVDIYRRQYGLFATSAILYNHESPLRRPEFVTRKVTRAVARAMSGAKEPLGLGDVNATRDWGFAGDTVEAVWLMLQGAQPADYVVATGVSRTVSELCEVAFASAGLDWREHVSISPSDGRPNEVVPLVGDATRLKNDLGWRPKMPFDRMIRRMVEHDYVCTQRGSERVLSLDEL